MPEPMSPEQYAAALAELDEHIGRVHADACGSYTEDSVRVELAVLALTEATLAIAKGIRLLAEPPPVSIATVETPRFGLVLTDEEKAEEARHPEERN